MPDGLSCDGRVASGRHDSHSFDSPGAHSYAEQQEEATRRQAAIYEAEAARISAFSPLGTSLRLNAWGLGTVGSIPAVSHLRHLLAPGVSRSKGWPARPRRIGAGLHTYVGRQSGGTLGRR